MTTLYSVASGLEPYAQIVHTCKFPTVTDREKKECMDPEGNGVTIGRGEEGGGGVAGPPSGEQDKQVICSSGGGKTPIREQGGQQDGSDATSRTHHAQSM
jgi:hypothetical protein